VLHVVMQQHVYCLGYVSFVSVMYCLPGLVLYRSDLVYFIDWIIITLNGSSVIVTFLFD